MAVVAARAAAALAVSQARRALSGSGTVCAAEPAAGIWLSIPLPLCKPEENLARFLTAGLVSTELWETWTFREFWFYNFNF